jgi:hypothetical protein
VVQVCKRGVWCSAPAAVCLGQEQHAAAIALPLCKKVHPMLHVLHVAASKIENTNPHCHMCSSRLLQWCMSTLALAMC